MNDVDVRAGREGDEDQIQRLDAACFFDAASLNYWRQELARSAAHYFVLEREGKLLGFGGYWLVADEAQITKVALADAERGKGFGRRLMNELIEDAWRRGAVAIQLEVRSGNAAALALYRGCGFESAGVRPHYYADNGEGAVIMWLYAPKDGKENV